MKEKKKNENKNNKRKNLCKNGKIRRRTQYVNKLLQVIYKRKKKQSRQIL